MWRRILLATFAALTIGTPLLAQETENYGPPPIVWAVPRIQLYNGDGPTRVLRGLEASLALPLSPRTNVTATWTYDTETEDTGTATFNYDHPVGDDTVLRGSIGLIRDDFGYGLTLHRAMREMGVGAFAQSVDGSFEGGLMLTKQVPWGVKLGKVPTPRRSESSNWNSGAGDVGDLGARVALGYRSGDASEIAFSTAYFPQRRQSWPREGHSVQSASYSSTSFAPPAKPAWRYQTEGPVRSSAAIVDGVAYVGSYDGWLYALDVMIGRRLWRFPAESAITGAPSWADEHLYFGTEAGEVFCVAQPRKNGPPTGQLVWRYKTSAAVTSSPLVTDSGLVIVGSCDAYIYALDRVTGKLVWKIPTGGPVMASASKITRRIPAGVDMNGKPTARSASVLVGSSDGKLYAIEEVSGQVIWTFTSDGPITAAPVLSADRLFLANRSGSLYSLQPATGKQVWSVRLPGALAHSPAVDDQRLYAGTAEGTIIALESQTGKLLWQCDLKAALAASPTLVSGHLMYIASRDGRLWTLDRPTGRVVNFTKEGEPLTTCAAIADGHLLVGGDNGSVYAYVPGAAGLPLPPMEVADLPKPVTPIEPDRPLPQVTPPATNPATSSGPTITDKPATPVTLPPTAKPAEAVKPAAPATPVEPSNPTPAVTPVTPPTTPPAQPVTPVQPVAKPVETPPAPVTPPAPTVVVVKPTTPVTTPPPGLSAPAAPGTPAPPTATRGPESTPGDFPRAVTPLSGPVTSPATPVVVTPTTPPVTPPATPAATATTTTSGKPPSATLASRIPLLTLLATPADGRTPVLLSNQSYLYVGGKIAPGSDIAAIRVNGLDAPIRNGEYQMQVTFPGPGDYLLLVEAVTRDGERSTYRRSITVVEGLDAVSPNKLIVRQRGGSGIAVFVPGSRGLQLSRFKKTLEIRNAQGQLIHNWVSGGDEAVELTWNGANADGKPVPPGDYEAIYILSGENGPLAWLRQPLEVQE